MDGITDSMDMSLGKLPPEGGLACCSPWGRKESDMTATEVIQQHHDSTAQGDCIRERNEK